MDVPLWVFLQEELLSKPSTSKSEGCKCPEQTLATASRVLHNRKPVCTNLIDWKDRPNNPYLYLTIPGTLWKKQRCLLDSTSVCAFYKPCYPEVWHNTVCAWSWRSFIFYDLKRISEYYMEKKQH